MVHFIQGRAVPEYLESQGLQTGKPRQDLSQTAYYGMGYLFDVLHPSGNKMLRWQNPSTQARSWVETNAVRSWGDGSYNTDLLPFMYPYASLERKVKLVGSPNISVREEAAKYGVDPQTVVNYITAVRNQLVNYDALTLFGGCRFELMPDYYDKAGHPKEKDGRDEKLDAAAHEAFLDRKHRADKTIIEALLIKPTHGHGEQDFLVSPVVAQLLDFRYMAQHPDFYEQVSAVLKSSTFYEKLPARSEVFNVVSGVDYGSLTPEDMQKVLEGTEGEPKPKRFERQKSYVKAALDSKAQADSPRQL